MYNKLKNKFCVLLSMLLIFTLLIPQQVFANSHEDKYEALRILANQRAEILVNHYNTTSVQYALLYDGKILVSGNAGVYSRTEDRLLSSDTMYGIGSLSKIYTTAAVLNLVDKGLVNLEEPVTKYLPKFSMLDERYRDITVRMLLNHSSGLMGSSFRNAFLFDDNDSYAKYNLLSMLSTQRLKADPGDFSVYCNDGFTLAELIVEEVSGKSFTDFLSTEFFNILGLTNTKTPKSDFDRESLARTYHPLVESALPVDNTNVIGTGGIYTTAEEVVAFSKMFMNKAYEMGSDILSSNIVQKSFEKEYAKGLWSPEHDNIIGFGLGWDSVDLFPFNHYDIKAVAKGGDTVQYHSNLIVLPEHNMSMAVLSSGGSSMFNQTFATGILLEALKLEGYIEAFLPEAVNIEPIKATMPESLLEYSGLYGNMLMVQKIDIDSEGVLTRTIPAIPQVPPQRFVYTKEGVFAALDGSGSLGFVTEDNGIKYMTNFGYATLPGLGQIASMSYSGQKLAPLTLTEDIHSTWTERDGKEYYVINEKYSSQVYLISMPVAKISLHEETPGYIGNATIIDHNQAKPLLKIPGISGRDLSDLYFFIQDGKEYLKFGVSLLVSEDYIETLYTKRDAVCTILEDGYSRWYRVHPEDAGKKIIVNVPQNAAFAIYDSGEYTNFSLVSGNHSATLTEESKLVFIGDVGARFLIRFE